MALSREQAYKFLLDREVILSIRKTVRHAAGFLTMKIQERPGGLSMSENLRVIIADDEPMVCVVVKKCVHWETLGLELAGIAYDGEELLSLIRSSKPDIVITDISMPELSGLDMIEEVRKEGLNCKFIIISGYRQFEYAHKALKNNVDDYLLKPINEQELNESLSRVRMSILEEERHGKKAVDILITNHKKDKDNIRRMFLSQMLTTGEAFLSDRAGLEEEYGICFSEGLYQAMEAKFDILKKEDLSEGLSSVQTKLITIFKNIFEKECREIFIDTVDERILIGINYDAEYQNTINEKCRKFFEYGKNIADLFLGFTLTVGVSRRHKILSEFPQAFREAMTAVSFRLTEGTDKVIFYENLNVPENRWGVQEKERIKETVAADFEILNKEHFKQYINSLFFQAGGKCNAAEIVALSRLIVEIFFRDRQYIEGEIENASCLYKKAMKKIDNAVTLPDLKNTVLNAVLPVMEELEEKKNSQKKKPVRAAQAFIEKHFHEALTLETVANEVNLNPVYFSNIFKKETNENFVDYLHKCRIEAAKEMLRKEDTPIVNIASKVGYYDAKYFSKMFRKYVGIKPSDYRKIYG